MTSDIIKFDNLLNEMKYAYHSGNFARAEGFASEIRGLCANAKANEKTAECHSLVDDEGKCLLHLVILR